ncbi:glycoside hydrolase family protein [Agrobacterium vitis]
MGSRAATLAKQRKFREACEAQTAWNKAGGQVVNGLVKRREMGDAQRIGEAEICVSGLQ